MTHAHTFNVKQPKKAESPKSEKSLIESIENKLKGVAESIAEEAIKKVISWLEKLLTKLKNKLNNGLINLLDDIIEVVRAVLPVLKVRSSSLFDWFVLQLKVFSSSQPFCLNPNIRRIFVIFDFYTVFVEGCIKDGVFGEKFGMFGIGSLLANTVTLPNMEPPPSFVIIQILTAWMTSTILIGSWNTELMPR